MRAFLERLQRKFSEIKSVSNETEQALIRVAFVSFITLYLLLNRSAYEPVALCLIYLCLGILMLINILRHPQKNEKRQWTALVIDLTATSLEQMISGPMAGIFVGIYLWLIMGYGLRYGTKFFKGCYALGVIGFSTTLYLNPYWSNHQHLAYGFLLTLILIPLHTMRLQINLENAIRQADLANRAKTNFLSNISHEIRTPLNGIIGASELLAQTTLDSKQKQLLEMAGTSASTLKKLINDVLDINKIEKGKIELETQSFFLPDMLQRLNQICQPEIERKRLWLRIHIDPSAQRYFSGSLQHIEQVLMNLLANAIKFTQHGGVHVYVNTTQQFAAMSMVRFRILDTGIGIKADALPHIFDSFTQADSSISKRYGGTGLGTTIAKQLVELMAGEISVFSEEGAGTTFEVLLPLQHSEASSAEGSDIDLSPVSNVVPLSSHNRFRKKIRVLIADDNAVNRMILSEILQGQHCIVKAVDSGDAALDVLEHQQFDLMILDYNMPVMNGLEVFTLYHALPGSRPLKTVILTADATPATQERCLQAGILRVLTKPVISKQIRMLIEEIAQLKQQESKASKPARNGRQTGKTTPVTSASEAVTAEFPGNTKVAKLTPSNEPCLDQARLEHLVKLGGGEAFVFRLITEFIENTDDVIRLLGAQCRDLNFDQVSKLAHSLAGESANMGLIPLSKASRRLLKLTMEDAQMISDLYQAVVEVYDDTRLQLQQYRSKLSSKRSHK